jgi:hypothetical protein
VLGRLEFKAEEHVRLVVGCVIQDAACVSAAALEALRCKHEFDKSLA